MENTEGKDSVFLISFQCCSDVYAECHDIMNTGNKVGEIIVISWISCIFEK